LKTHIETVHEKHRDHVCGYCKGVAFGTASNLKNHMRISAIQIHEDQAQPCGTKHAKK